MNILKQKGLDDLRQAREHLLSIKKNVLTSDLIFSWHGRWTQAFIRVGHLLAEAVNSQVIFIIQGYEAETDREVLDDVRLRAVTYLDGVMVRLDSTQTVRPILDELISRVKDTKLAELLKEFNATRTMNPNLAAIGFRTIVTLIIQERAKIVNPASKLATKADLGFEPDIKAAISEHIFSSAEEKYLHRHLTGGKKDTFDNVAHKPGEKTLVHKDDLDDAVDLLNKLLPTII